MNRLLKKNLQTWGILLLCSMLSISLSAQIETESINPGPDLDMDSLANTTSDYYTSVVSNMQDECATDAHVEATVVIYKSSSLVELRGNADGQNLILYREGKSARPVKLGKSPVYLNLPNDKEFRLMGTDKCGKPSVLAEFETSPRPAGAPLELTPELYNVVREWQTGPKNSMARFLKEYRGLSSVQKSYLAQQLMYLGTPLPDKYAFDPENIKPSVSPVPSDPQEKSNCRCTTIRMTHTNQISPFERIRDNGSRRDIYGVYGSNSNSYDVGGGDVKVWSGWGFEGPARWNALTAQHDGCPRAPFGATWAAEVDEENLVNDFEEGYEVTMPAPNFAIMEFNYLCLDRDGNSSDTNCQCDEDKTVRIQAQYHSLTKSKAQVFGGGFLCGKRRNAAAEAVDFGLLSVGTPLNEDNPNGVGDFQNIAVSLNASATDCGSYYTGPGVTDFLELAYYVYRYTKSGKLIETGNGPVDDVIETGFQQYYSNNVFDKLRSMFDEPWREYTGRCGGDQNGRPAVFQLLDENGNSSPTQGQAGIVNFTAKFNINKPVTVMLSSGSSMRVAGQRRWKADASVLSSFRLASVVLATPTINDDGDAEQCCTPGMASYSLSAISGDDPSSGVTENAWRGLTQSFFSLWGFSNFRVRPDDEINSYIRKSSVCPNDIFVESPDKSLLDNGNGKPIANESFTDYAILTELSVYDLAGRQLWRGKTSLPRDSRLLTNLELQLPNGIYILSRTNEAGEIKTSKFFHSN